MQAFQFKLKEKVLRIQPYEDQRKKFMLFQQKQVQQQQVAASLSRTQFPQNLDETDTLQSGLNNQLRVIRFNQQPLLQPFQKSVNLDSKSLPRETPRMSKQMEMIPNKIEQSLNLNLNLDQNQQSTSFTYLKAGGSSSSSSNLRTQEKQQQDLMIKKNRPSSATGEQEKAGKRNRESTNKVKLGNQASRSNSSESTRKNYCISPNRASRVVQQTKQQVDKHKKNVDEQIQIERVKYFERKKLAKKYNKAPSFQALNSVGSQEELNQQNENQLDNEKQIDQLQENQNNENEHFQQENNEKQNSQQQLQEQYHKYESFGQIQSENSFSSNAIKVQHKLKLKPKVRAMSPQERGHHQNIRFLNTIKRPTSADQDDNLSNLKTIYTTSKKNQIQPSLTKQVATTHDFAAQQKFREIYKRVDRSKEQIQVLNQEETPLHSILFKIDEKNKLPLKYGIARERKNSKVIDVSYFNIGDQSVDIFCAGLSKLEGLEVLNLKHNGFTEQGIQQVIDCMNIDVKELDLSNNQVTEANIDSLLQKFVVDQYNLQVLKLEKTNLGDQAVDILCTGLQYIKSLRIVNLSYNQITNRSCYSIEDMILNVYNLRELYLHWNKIQGEGGTLVIDACRENGKVKVLDLSYNQLGVSSNYDLFNNAFKKLCDANNENSICHLDLSFNQFRIQECLFISRALKKNQSIIGFHFSGNDCYITAQGFLNQCYAKDLMDAKNIPISSKRIDGCKFKGYNEYRLMQEKEEEMPIRVGDNCWICEGWQEHTFEWSVKSGDLENIDVIYLHLEIDGYTALRMNDENSNIGYFYLVRMIPPKSQIRYFFSLDGLTNIKIAKDQPMSYEHNGIIVNFTSKDIDHSRKSFIFEDIINSQKDWQSRKDKIQSQIEACSSGAGNKKKIEDLQQFQKDEEKAIKKEMDNVQFKIQGNMVFFDKIIKRQKKIEVKIFNVFYSKKYFNVIALKKIEKVQTQAPQQSKLTSSKGQTQQQIPIQIINNPNTSSNNLADLSYVPQIKVRPRMYLQGREQIQLATNAWDFQQSVFKDYKFEDEMLLKKCFEFDWECSRINQIVRDENDLAQVKDQLRGIYNYIRNAYKILAAIGTIVDVPCIMMNTFTDFINKTNILDNINLKLSDVDLKFVVTKTSSRYKRNPRNPDKGLIRYQFMEILVRLAEDKYIRHKITNKFSDAISLLLNEGYLSALKKYQISQNWRQSNLWNERCDYCFKFYNPIIKSVFNKYCDPGKKRQFMSFKFMTMEEFRNLCHDTELMGSRFTERDINSIFNQSMMIQIDEIKYERHFQMGIPELIEAIARLADKLIHEKLDSFIKEWNEKIQRTQQQKIQAQAGQVQPIIVGDDKPLQKKRLKKKNSSIVFSDSDFDQEEGSRIDLDQNKGFFQGIQIFHKIESLFYAFYQKCVSDDLKEQFQFPAVSIFAEPQKEEDNSKKFYF